MHFEHLAWGLQITVLGMGLVFGLLALLWGLLVLAVWLDRAPVVDATPSPPAAGAIDARAAIDAHGDVDAVEPAVLAAIAVALRSHLRAGRRGGSGATPEERVHWPGSLLHASRWVAAGRGRQTRNWQRRR